MITLLSAGPGRRHVGVQIKPLEGLAARREAESEKFGMLARIRNVGSSPAHDPVYAEPGELCATARPR